MAQAARRIDFEEYLVKRIPDEREPVIKPTKTREPRKPRKRSSMNKSLLSS